MVTAAVAFADAPLFLHLCSSFSTRAARVDTESAWPTQNGHPRDKPHENRRDRCGEAWGYQAIRTSLDMASIWKYGGAIKSSDTGTWATKCCGKVTQQQWAGSSHAGYSNRLHQYAQSRVQTVQGISVPLTHHINRTEEAPDKEEEPIDGLHQGGLVVLFLSTPHFLPKGRDIVPLLGGLALRKRRVLWECPLDQL